MFLTKILFKFKKTFQNMQRMRSEKIYKVLYLLEHIRVGIINNIHSINTRIYVLNLLWLYNSTRSKTCVPPYQGPRPGTWPHESPTIHRWRWAQFKNNRPCQNLAFEIMAENEREQNLINDMLIWRESVLLFSGFWVKSVFKPREALTT